MIYVTLMSLITIQLKTYLEFQVMTMLTLLRSQSGTYDFILPAIISL